MIKEIQLEYLKSIDIHATPQWGNINILLLLFNCYFLSKFL